MTDDGWARLLVKGYAQPDTCAEFVQVVGNVSRRSQPFANSSCHCDLRLCFSRHFNPSAIHDQLSLRTNFDVVATLIGRVHVLGGDALNLILGIIMLWYPKDIPELLWLRPFNIPWSDPATLVNVLDVYLDPSFTLQLVQPLTVGSVWIHASVCLSETC
ncbi:hypothetical protein BCR44DRAFT_1285094 [Catenaria anguillulae PL171]|uniref:Uncharacterized protein n=1 Tax=Catenaria anguillulae PL171 TaxID=765915 RepID=A0A1Y2HWI9_9FUNG|nr:hypothetical protein BCR44DRAFT_1285094 [Catenaria anguillulae PL171]